MAGKQWASLALTAAALLAGGQAQASLPYAQVMVMDPHGMLENVGGMGTPHAEVSFTDGGRTASAQATAGYGVLKTYAMAASSEVDGLTGSAIASWSDSITLHNAALAGTQGTLRLNFSYTYELAASTEKLGVAAQGFYTNSVSVSSLHLNSYEASAHHQIDSYDGVNTLSGYGSIRDYAGTHAPADGQFSLLVDFIWGEPIGITQTAGIACGVGFFEGAPGASCTADSLHSSYWSGITEVMSGGIAVADFTVSSTSGTDYSVSFVPQPVPEPAQVWMLLGGALAGALVLRRRNASLRHG